MSKVIANAADPIKSTGQNGPTPGLSTLAVHAGEARQKTQNSLTDSIVCTSTYSFPDTQSVVDYIELGDTREEYGRYGNPSQRVVEAKLAALERGECCLLYASGMAAIVGLLMAKLQQGDEIIFFDECYHRTREFCAKHLSRFGVLTREVKTNDFDALEAAVTPRTRMLFSESPTNPHLSIVDIERFAALGHRLGIETAIDSTLATPFNLQPLSLGVDYVLHSATKYLAGHNDLLAGCIVGPRDKLSEIEQLRGIMGGIISPHSTFLLQRGLKTFELRMSRHNQNGLAVANFLQAHPRVSIVYYPGLETHANHQMARKTMAGFGGLVTFEIKDADWRQTAAVVDRMRIARIAPSLGGVESLIEQPMVMSYFQASSEDRERWGIRDNMIRISCGIEDTIDLLADLEQALET